MMGAERSARNKPGTNAKARGVYVAHHDKGIPQGTASEQMFSYRERWFLLETHDVKHAWMRTNDLSQLNPAIFDFRSFGFCSQ